MITAVATLNGLDVEIALIGAPLPAAEEGEEEEEHVATNDKNPIAPEPKELIWGFGSFVVLALLMRYFLYPRLRKGMDARYALIRGGHEQAEFVTDSARDDVATYDAQLATIKAEAQSRIEAARSTLEGERAEQLAAANARIADKRAAAATQVEQARQAAEGDVENAVRAVAGRAGELATGRAPDPSVVSSAVAETMSGGGTMNALAAHLVPMVNLLPTADEHHVDESGSYTTHHWLWPEQAELIYGGLAAVIIIGLLIWKAGPLAKKAFIARTERIQTELDESAQAKADADAEAGRIRQALGDIESERQRLLADADAQAEALLVDGRVRLEAEVADLEAKADADIAAAATRTGDELRNEIARLASAAADRVVEQSLDGDTQQRLIEDFISKVGASAGANA